MAKRKTTRFLQSYATSGDANPAVDIQAIRTIRERRHAIQNNPLAGQTDRWKHHQTDTDSLDAFSQRASELRQSIIQLARIYALPREISQALLPALDGESTDLPVLKLAQNFLNDSQAFLQALQGFGQIADGSPVTNESSEIVATSLATVEHIQKHRTLLQRWTAWCGVTERAATAGLTPVVRSLTSNEIQAQELVDRFRLAYARWWLPKIIIKTRFCVRFNVISTKTQSRTFVA